MSERKFITIKSLHELNVKTAGYKLYAQLGNNYFCHVTKTDLAFMVRRMKINNVKFVCSITFIEDLKSVQIIF